MTVVDTLFKHHSADPQRLGEELLRALASDPSELRLAAQRWCEFVAPLSRSELRPVYRLMRFAGEGNPLFLAFVDKAAASHASDVLVGGMLRLYAQRDQPAAWERLLIDWTREEIVRDEMRARVPMTVADAFCEYPELAYALIAEPIESRWLSATESDPRLASTSIALLRRLRGYAEHPLDRAALSGVTAAEYFEHFRPDLHALLAARKAVPTEVWSVVDQQLSVAPGSEMGWYEALWLKMASVEHRDAAIALLGRCLERAADPARWFEAASGSALGRSGLFAGPGWGRDELGKRLLPIARVFVRRGEWPTKSWLSCFTIGTATDRPIEDQVQGRYERVKDVLAEALLERALDPDEDVATRSRAVQALGELSPTGKGSAIRALGKLHPHPFLGPLAKAAQKEARDRARESHLDAELTLMDGWARFAEGDEGEPSTSPPRSK